MGSGRGSVGARARVCVCIVRAGGRVVPMCGRVGCLPMWARAHPVALASLQKEESAKRKKEPHLLAGGMGRRGRVGVWVRRAHRTTLTLRAHRPGHAWAGVLG